VKFRFLDVIIVAAVCTVTVAILVPIISLNMSHVACLNIPLNFMYLVSLTVTTTFRKF
jgi:hypothetical protein